jgi:hypothetical protein
MKGTLIIALLSIFSGLGLLANRSGHSRQSFDKSDFYAVMASGNLRRLNAELAAVEAAPIAEREAYEGALLMRKAGQAGPPAVRLKFFRSGRIKLESALNTDSTNGEYHFLRLSIQEHVPHILKYSKDLEKDSQIIHATFRYLAPAVQRAIVDYSKKSKTLHPEDFDQRKPLIPQ